MRDIFDDIQPAPDPIDEQLEGLFNWIEEDYGPSAISSVVKDLMHLTRDNPDMPFEDVIFNVSLEWSK